LVIQVMPHGQFQKRFAWLMRGTTATIGTAASDFRSSSKPYGRRPGRRSVKLLLLTRATLVRHAKGMQKFYSAPLR
jgi:hypothetical protein